MSNYLPWYGKKREGFKHREDRLLRLLSRDGKPAAIDRAVAEVRAAKIRALRSDQFRIPPCGRDDNDERLRRFDEAIAQWAALPSEEILAIYRQRLVKSRERPTAPEKESENPAHLASLSESMKGEAELIGE